MTASRSSEKAIFLVLPGQCFSLQALKPWLACTFVLVERCYTTLHDRHHQLKLVMMLSALREYAKVLEAAGAQVVYEAFEDSPAESLVEQVKRVRVANQAAQLIHFEIEDRDAAREVAECAAELGLSVTELPSPMFLCSRTGFSEYLETDSKPRMANFYRRQRIQLGLLLSPDGKPLGGQWSLDAQNRRPLPKTVAPPEVEFFEPNEQTREVMQLVAERFSNCPGDAMDYRYPVNHQQAQRWLKRFIHERLSAFGDYEDALTTRSDVVFHSLLSPLINFGLLSPQEVIDQVLRFHKKNPVPLNSLEGFIRQLIGWREFVRGVYHHFGEHQESTNFFGHSAGLTDDWYVGTTGIAPLDHVIRKTRTWGWAHHIERLMVVGNLMNLCRIHPQAVHQWFMEMYIDSAHWVMGPNVYGMALFSDGGVFATKPYICGSSYLLKMGDYGKGDWCDIVDGLYWRFVHDHRDYLMKNQRTAMMPRNLDRLKSDRRERIFRAAQIFLDQKTRAPI